MKRPALLITISIVCFVGSLYQMAYGYELATHGALTYEAYNRSVLKDVKLLADLGIDLHSNPGEPFGISYYDVSGNVIQPRFRDEFEGNIIQKLGPQPLSLEGWLLRGAIREDDYIVDAPNPQDDPYNTGDRILDSRPLNHFYDPYYNRPLTAGIVPLGQRAPNWATGAVDAWSDPNTPQSYRRNHFTIFDAREAMYRALTGKTKDGKNATPNATDTDPAPENIRKTWWATTFRALGDVVHLVEDMAQPQHTRNDAHSGMPGFGHKSVYELFVECRATQSGVDNLGTYNIKDCPGLTYAGYPDVVFAKYSDYFSTHAGMGLRLGDDSNRGFFPTEFFFHFTRRSLV